MAARRRRQGHTPWLQQAARIYRNHPPRLLQRRPFQVFHNCCSPAIGPGTGKATTGSRRNGAPGWGAPGRYGSRPIGTSNQAPASGTQRISSIPPAQRGHDQPGAAMIRNSVDGFSGAWRAKALHLRRNSQACIVDTPTTFPSLQLRLIRNTLIL
jgi:hypothetical protein